MREAFILAQIARGHGPVRKRDLHVERHGDDVRDQHERHSQRPGGDAPPYRAVAEKAPIDEHEAYLSRMYLCRGTHATGAR